MHKFKLAILRKLGMLEERGVDPRDVAFDWELALIEDDEWEVLYGG